MRHYSPFSISIILALLSSDPVVSFDSSVQTETAIILDDDKLRYYGSRRGVSGAPHDVAEVGILGDPNDFMKLFESLDIDAEQLEELINPTEEKVNAMSDMTVKMWAATPSEFPPETRQKLIVGAEELRVLGLEQVGVFNAMLTIKAIFDSEEGRLDEENRTQLRKELLLLRAKFLELHDTMWDIVLQQQTTTEAMDTESLNEVEASTGFKLLQFRNQLLLDRFEPYLKGLPK